MITFNKINLFLEFLSGFRTKTVKAAALLFTLHSSLFTLISCSDKWDDHYTAEQQSVGTGTLWGQLESNSTLSRFTSVLKACGYDRQLSGSQTYTVFAPTDDVLTAEEASNLITAYQQQKDNGVKDDDNTTVKQFVKNHISLYRHPVSSLSNDSVAMLNGKYQVLCSSAIGASKMVGKTTTVSNGMLYTIDKEITYFPNVYEYLRQDADLDSIYQFLSSHDVYEFQPSMSVPGSINEEGMTEYLDSVSTRYNSITSSLGYIDREDSTYWFVAPTNAEWKRLYDEYMPYFTYANTVAKHDSLQQANARRSIIEGAFFNRTENPDPAVQDSALCTQAGTYLMRRLLGTEDKYVYYKPFAAGGIFQGAQQVECSNGKVFKASDYRIDKAKTFFGDIKIEAEDISRQDTLLQCESPLTVRDVPTDNPFYNKISGNQYVDVIAKNNTDNPNTWPQPQIRFSVPNTLANVPYDIYVVMAPVEAYNTSASAEDKLPNRFSGFVYYYNKDNKLQQTRIPTKTSKPGQVDSILVASNIKFPTCGVNLSNPVVRIQMISQVTRNNTSQYSNTLHIDCIILRPKR